MSDEKKHFLQEYGHDTLPESSKKVSWSEVIELTSIHASRLGELIELGWIIPARTSEDLYLFELRDVYRIKKLTRICADLDVTATGGTIIVDLLERIEHLEDKLRKLERSL